ncbi:MAG: tRNA (adenosine(37)-N6)-threonylcarbamoyltransferase complex ATPase subunit type 1 TsaE [Acidimicrobiia bacterium]
MSRYRTTGVDETRRLAAAISALARPGDLILLVGDLGAGKTAFAQGFAAALGVEEQVTSPTFTLARTYQGRLTLNHLDVYRLDRLQEADDLGLAELVDDGGVTLIEWGDAVRPALPPDYLEVRLAFGAGPDPTGPAAGDLAAVDLAAVDAADDVRDIELSILGPSWTSRAHALGAAVEAWGC